MLAVGGRGIRLTGTRPVLLAHLHAAGVTARHVGGGRLHAAPVLVHFLAAAYAGAAEARWLGTGIQIVLLTHVVVKGAMRFKGLSSKNNINYIQNPMSNFYL